VIRLVKSGDEPTHVPDEVIAAIRRRERNGAIDLPKKRGLKTGDRVRIVSGLFAGRSGLCAGVSREHVHARGAASGAAERRRGRAGLTENPWIALCAKRKHLGWRQRGIEATAHRPPEQLVNVRFGSKADIGLPPVDVRFTPKSGARLQLAQIVCNGLKCCLLDRLA
jgi:hypothetical protein